jgi:hypothetical protein
MDNNQTKDIIHSFSNMGQMFHSYEQLLLNPNININPKKLAEICGKCAKNCMEARNLLLENIQNNEEVKK